MRTPVLAAALIWSLATAASAMAALSGSGGAVNVQATGPAGLKIDGKTSSIAVSEANEAVHVVIALATIDTGINLRNKHMREKFLETDKYPTAELLVPRASLRFPNDGEPAAATATGTLTLHGQTKPISFTYRAKRAQTTYEVTGDTHIDMRDFAIQIPSYLGVTVKPDVTISVSFVTKDG